MHEQPPLPMIGVVSHHLGFCGTGIVREKFSTKFRVAGMRFRLSPATCDVSIRLSGDRQSMDEHGLQRFPLPVPDAGVRALQDALPWTCWDSPEPDRSVVGLLRDKPSTAPQCATLGYSQGCVWLPDHDKAQISGKCCVFNTVESRIGIGTNLLAKYHRVELEIGKRRLLVLDSEPRPRREPSSRGYFIATRLRAAWCPRPSGHQQTVRVPFGCPSAVILSANA